MSLNDKVCLIVGASSGIGRAIALRCGKDGATVVLCARRMNLLEQIANEIGSNAHAVRMDVTDHSQVEEKISEILFKFKKIDILIYAAGIMTYSLVKNKFFDDWKNMIATNCQGLVDVVSTVFSDMLSKKIPGTIIAISSDAGRSPFPGLSVYTGTKFFTEGFLRSLRIEGKNSNIRVTSVQPGDVSTPSQQWTTDTEAAQLFSPLHVPPAECAKAWEAMLKPEQVADAVAFAILQPEGTSVNEILIQPINGPC